MQQYGTSSQRMSPREREEARKRESSKQKLMVIGAIAAILLAGLIIFWWYKQQQGTEVAHIDAGLSPKAMWMKEHGGQINSSSTPIPVAPSGRGDQQTP